jgi:hypothetical protein
MCRSQNTSQVVRWEGVTVRHVGQELRTIRSFRDVRVLRRKFCNLWFNEGLDGIVEMFTSVSCFFLCGDIMIIHASLRTRFGCRSIGTTRTG